MGNTSVARPRIHPCGSYRTRMYRQEAAPRRYRTLLLGSQALAERIVLFRSARAGFAIFASIALVILRKDRSQQSHGGRHVRRGIERRLPCLLEDEALQQGKHHPRNEINVEIFQNFTSSLGIPQDRCEAVALPYPTFCYLPYLDVVQRLRPELNRDLAPLPFLRILQQFNQSSSEPFKSCGQGR